MATYMPTATVFWEKIMEPTYKNCVRSEWWGLNQKLIAYLFLPDATFPIVYYNLKYHLLQIGQGTAHRQCHLLCDSWIYYEKFVKASPVLE